MTRFRPILTFIFMLTLLASCSSFERHDDAVRIQKDASEKYDFYFVIDGGDTVNIIPRNSYTLRGTVINMVRIISPENCDDNSNLDSSYYLTFLSEAARDESGIEMIPLSDVELIGPALDLELNEYGNINYFENFNDPLEPRTAREVPVEEYYLDTCGKQCNCHPLVGPHIQLELKCPDCDYKHYFVELRGAYAAYNDFKLQNGVSLSTESWFAEIAAGYRTEKWGIGLAYASGVPIYNSYTSTRIWRPSLMLHGRYHFDPFSCMVPFLYGQFGMAIDKFSLDLGKVSFCDDCETQIDIKPPDADISIPLSYGIGAGIDIPITGCLFDLSFDLGYRSLAIGENFRTLQFTNVPTKRRIHMFVFRMGITLGY